MLLGAAAAAPAAAVGRPSVLVHSARPTLDQWRWWVDLTYLRELHERGFEVDYTDRHSDFTWERVRRYDVLVIYVCPLERGKYYDNTPDLPPYGPEFVTIVERFLAAGGGVFLMARSINADESFLPLIERWGARIPHELIEEADPTRLAVTPRMGGRHRLWFVDDVPDSPVSRGVSQVWLPLTPHYAAAETMPIHVSDAWQVVLRGPPTSRTVAIGPEQATMLAPPAAFSRAGGVSQPALFALRPYGTGRIAFCAIWPQYSIGQGTQWLYDRRVLDRGIDDRPSHFGTLIENVLGWLAESRPRSVGGFATDPARLFPPNLRPGVKSAFVGQSAASRPDAAAELERALSHGSTLRGLIGAQVALDPRGTTVAAYARAARESGLAFVVFLQDAARLAGPDLARLRDQCREHSGPDLQLYPGYWMETNTGNRMFLFGPGVELPPPELWFEGRFNQQLQDPSSGAFLVRRSPLIDWLVHRMMNGGQVNIGYFGFSDRPTAQPIEDLRLYSMLALTLYREGRLVEDNLEAYLATAEGALPPVPVAVHLVDSPRALRRAAHADRGMTRVRADSVAELWPALAYADVFEAPNVFVSNGPAIEAWPVVRQVYTFAAEDFVARAAYMPAPIAVSSPSGLKEIRIYDGRRLFRRFDGRGEVRFHTVLELPASLQRTLVLVAEDRAGGRAVSTALRTWKGGEGAAVFCGDRINVCSGPVLLGRGPGVFQVAAAPEIDAGTTWDGGPGGAQPAMLLGGALRPALQSDLGREGHRGFANRPALVLSDEGAVRVRALLDRVYDPRVPVMNPWHTFGPLGGPSSLLRAEVGFTALDRPSIGPRPTGFPGLPAGYGAFMSVFESDLTFRRDQTVSSLEVLAQQAYGGPFPLWLVHGRGSAVRARYELRPDRKLDERPRLDPGDWLGCWAEGPVNLSVHVNRGAPLELRFRAGSTVGTGFHAVPEPAAVRAGQSVHVELLSVVDPLDPPRGGLERVLEIVGALTRADGLRVGRGTALGATDGQGARPRQGLLELEARDGAVEIGIDRPANPTGVPLAVRVHGLNPNWSAGMFLGRGYVLGNYGPGEGRYRAVGVDEHGRAWTALCPDLAEQTEVTIGHPVVCDRGELFVQVTLRDDPPGEGRWHVSVHNPTHEEVRASCRAAIPMPGLSLGEAAIAVPPGATVVLR